jgi:uncharacterized protein YhbP (UPF0306 family)
VHQTEFHSQSDLFCQNAFYVKDVIVIQFSIVTEISAIDPVQLAINKTKGKNQQTTILPTNNGERKQQ